MQQARSCIHPALVAGVVIARNLVGEGAAGLQRGVHVGNLALHQLEGADRLVELPALAHVGQGDVQRGLHQPDRAAAQHQALGVEAAHQHLDAVVDFAQHVGSGDCAVLEHQLAGVAAAHAQLVQFLRGGKTGHAFLDDEGGHALAARVLAGSAHVHHQHIGLRAIGDPHLVAIGDPVAVAKLGAAAH